MGVAYHGHYLVWFELGRTELMRRLGATYGTLEEQRGIAFPVIQVGARYHAPARYDETVHVDTRVVQVGGARVRFEYTVTRDGTCLATGFSEHASVDRRGRPVRMPADLQRRLTETMEGAPVRDEGSAID